MSSYELSKLFSFNYFQDKSFFSNEATRKSNLDLLDKACKERLFKFVTHKNSQVRTTFVLPIVYKYSFYLKTADRLFLCNNNPIQTGRFGNFVRLGGGLNVPALFVCLYLSNF